MKRALFFLCAVFIFTASISYADTVEVKGKGFFSGTILKDQPDGIDFQDSYGEMHHFSSSEVIYIQKEPARAKGISFTSAKRSLVSIKKAAPRVKRGLFSAAKSAKTPGGFDHWLDSHMDEGERITDYMDQASQAASDFIFHGQAVDELVKTAQSRLTNFKQYKTDNLVLGGIGMAFMFFGALAFVIFGLRLIADAFDQHFLWGAAFLAIPLSYAAPLVGGSFGLLVLLPYFASLCFIVIYWRTTRAAFVTQIFCVNVLLIGFFILLMAS